MPARRFQKRPIVIEAIPVDDVLAARKANSTKEMPPWLVEAFWSDAVTFDFEGDKDGRPQPVKVRLFTKGHGWTTAKPGDWIIHGSHGEIYPCEGETFAHIYEPLP